MKSWVRIVAVFSALSAPSAVNSAEPLPGTKPLTEPADLARAMVDGLHAYLDRELAASVEKRKQYWKPDFTSAEAYAKSVAPNRERLRGILGVVDHRLPPQMEYVGGPGEPAAVSETAAFTAYAVRWAVLPGVDGEGLLLEPKGKPVAGVVAIPDAGQTPEQVAGLAPGIEKGSQFARRLAEYGCRVVVPTLLDRADTFSASPRLGRATNQPHREFVHRMAFEMGRTLAGYEVQKVLAAVDWLCRDDGHPPVGLYGYGDGGRVALFAAAADDGTWRRGPKVVPLPRIRATAVSGAFGPREGVADEPIDRNVWGLLREFGDAELVGLTATGRELLVEYCAGPQTAGPPAPRDGRRGAAPGRLGTPPKDSVQRELGRAGGTFGKDAVLSTYFWTNGGADAPFGDVGPFLRNFIPTPNPAGPPPTTDPPPRKGFDPAARQKRQFDQLVNFTQKLWRDSEASRKALFAKCDSSSPAAWDKSVEPLREMLHAEAIGKLPEPTIPLNPRTRRVYDEPAWTGYEVMLDVYPDVIAAGILLLPKDLKPGERRPVVVCQHGLEGTPRHTIEIEKRPVYNHFSRRLVEMGYIVYAPQNPYIFETHFRQVQRKANPLKLSLYSFIIRQHQRTIDWLETLPNVDPKRIGFYGLSYGGKTAMRVPAVEKRYAFSICSGDFNEWVGKNVSVDLDRSYMWTKEYEIYEWNLGHTFNYAEMAYLIAPRPFMVERGHDDGVGTDEMVSYEFAKVRYLYSNRLKIPDRTAIEYFPGGHQINAKETFAFIEKWIGKPR